MATFNNFSCFISDVINMTNSFVTFSQIILYSGRKITDSLGNVTVRGEKGWKEQEASGIVNSLSEHVLYNRKHLLLTAVLRYDTSAA
jgi:hypothetical protein